MEFGFDDFFFSEVLFLLFLSSLCDVVRTQYSQEFLILFFSKFPLGIFTTLISSIILSFLSFFSFISWSLDIYPAFHLVSFLPGSLLDSDTQYLADLASSSLDWQIRLKFYWILYFLCSKTGSDLYMYHYFIQGMIIKYRSWNFHFF